MNNMLKLLFDFEVDHDALHLEIIDLKYVHFEELSSVIWNPSEILFSFSTKSFQGDFK